VKWALVYDRDPRAQIAAINALVLLHGIVIEHGMLKRLAAATTGALRRDRGCRQRPGNRPQIVAGSLICLASTSRG
jgi:hypothetical protein